MTGTVSQPHESPEEAPGRSQPAGFDAYRSILRLVVGLALTGGDDLVTRLREWETANPPETAEPGDSAPDTSSDLARRALIGMVFEVAELTRQVVWSAAGLSASFATAMQSTFRPVTDSFLFRPLRASLEGIAARGEKRFERFVRTGRAEEPRSRQLAGEVTGLLMEDIVHYAGENPGVKALVDAQVDRLMPSLVTDATIQELLVVQLGAWTAGLSKRPESLDPLVQQVGDRYIAYLNEHPEDVQNLVQGQAASMASEVRDNVRTITVTGDTVLETVVRGLLRRTPRENLPPPDIRQRGNGAEPEQPREGAA